MIQFFNSGNVIGRQIGVLMANEANLKSSTGDSIALKSVHMEGRLEGLLLSLKLKQKYRNDSGKNLETVYTFPLAWGATLLGITVEIEGKRLQGNVFEKVEANNKFEKAIEDGDMPVMVEKSAKGLYTANLGNLKKNQEVTIEIEYAQLLRFEQNQLRLCIPTVIAPRYGDSHKSGGLAIHENAAVDPLAEYPLTLKIDILGTIAKAKLSCPSHRISTTPINDGVSVLLDRGGVLDRDFILNLDGIVGQSFAVTGTDGEDKTVLASFCPQLPLRNSAPLMLKILIDCSGSMAGDSIEAAKAGIHKVLQELNTDDRISYSRFGSKVVHDLDILQECNPSTIHFVSSALSSTEADMGGTELNEALTSTFKDIQTIEDLLIQPSVLLITDGEVWDVEAIVTAGLKHSQRIFAIGVGSSPAESLLRELAEKTGGACELVSPNEDIEAAIIRMFRRMRGSQVAQLTVDWGHAPIWQSSLPTQIYDGETVHVYASFSNSLSRVPKLSWEIEGHIFESQPESTTEAKEQSLVRLGGAKRIDSANSAEEKLALALKYQLVSNQTTLFLVHIRDTESKTKSLPSLQQINQMQAAGSGGFGSVRTTAFRRLPRSANVPFMSHRISAELSAPALWRSNKQNSATSPTAASLQMDHYDIPDFLIRKTSPGQTMPSPLDLLNCMNASAVTMTSYEEVLDVLIKLVQRTDIEKFMAEIQGDSLRNEQFWAVFLNWLATKFSGDFVLERHAQRMLKAQLALLDSVQIETSSRIIDVLLPSVGLNDWGQINGWTPLSRLKAKTKKLFKPELKTM
jgi:Ca-activated chloride channel family protein